MTAATRRTDTVPLNPPIPTEFYDRDGDLIFHRTDTPLVSDIPGDTLDDITDHFVIGRQADDLMLDSVDDATRRIAEREEYTLRGAWRAGYDYVHVYRPDTTPPLGRGGLTDTFSLPTNVLDPTNDPEPNGHWGRYLYTYDIGGVPDAEIRAAIRRGE